MVTIQNIFIWDLMSHMGFDEYDKSPENKIWYNLLDDGTEKKYIEEGKVIIKYRDSFAKEYCESKGFETEFEGYKVYAMNVGLAGSDWFKSVDEGSYDILMPFFIQWKKRHMDI